MPLLQNPNAFADYPLDKAGARRKDTAWLNEATRSPAVRVAVFDGASPLVDEAGAVFLGPEAFENAVTIALFLGVGREGEPYFAVQRRDDLALPEGAVFGDLRPIAPLLTDRDASILGCAKALFEWHARHGYCANCGSPSAVEDAGWRRSCPACGADHFPRVDPVAIMLPIFEERCCVGRQARFPPGMFSAFAGFVEPGESLEEACARELLEEAGLVAEAVAYHSSQPWPFPSSMMVGLHARVADATLTLDRDEIDDALWLTKEEARAALAGGLLLEGGRQVFTPPPLAIAHQLIKAWTFGAVRL
jgi:NAD+ diphosphatase